MGPSSENQKLHKILRRELLSGIAPAQFELDILHLKFLRNKRHQATGADLTGMISTCGRWLTVTLTRATIAKFRLQRNQPMVECCP